MKDGAKHVEYTGMCVVGNVEDDCFHPSICLLLITASPVQGPGVYPNSPESRRNTTRMGCQSVDCNCLLSRLINVFCLLNLMSVKNVF